MPATSRKTTITVKASVEDFDAAKFGIGGDFMYCVAGDDQTTKIAAAGGSVLDKPPVICKADQGLLEQVTTCQALADAEVKPFAMMSKSRFLIKCESKNALGLSMAGESDVDKLIDTKYSAFVITWNDRGSPLHPESPASKLTMTSTLSSPSGVPLPPLGQCLNDPKFERAWNIDEVRQPAWSLQHQVAHSDAPEHAGCQASSTASNLRGF